MVELKKVTQQMILKSNDTKMKENFYYFFGKILIWKTKTISSQNIAEIH